MITRFSEIGLTGRKRFACACGRKLTRQKRFYQTFNPYNRDANGDIKDQVTILRECRIELDRWASRPDQCTHTAKKPGHKEDGEGA